jgi:hypothetical protein
MNLRNLLLGFILFAIPLLLYGQSVDDIVSGNLQAMGGMEKLKSIQSLRITATVSNPDAPVSVIIQKKRPNLLRIDSTFKNLHSAEGYDGGTAWTTSMISTTPLEAAPEDLEAIQAEADFDSPLLDYKDKGNAVELDGRFDVNGKQSYKIKVTSAAGQTEYWYLDVDTYLLLKKTMNIHSQNSTSGTDIFFGQYTNVNGILFPFSIESRTTPQASKKVTIQKVELNINIDDSVFKMPTLWQPENKPQ